MSAPAAPGRFGMLGYWLALLLIGLLAIAPMLIFAAALVLVGDRPCQLSLSAEPVCMIGGANWGPPVQWMMYAPVMLIWSIPLSILLFIVWLVVMLIHRSAFNRRQRLA